MEVGLIGAFLGGVLTLLSPCSAVLLPGFFAYAFSTTSRLLGRTLVFYLGLLITLVPMGVAASALGSLVTEHRGTLVTVMAGLVIVLGGIQLLGISIPLPGRTVSHRRDSRSTLSVLLLGAVYGVAGVCSGPILGSVLAVAALGSNPVYGGLTLAVYALGMAVPVFVPAHRRHRKPGWHRADRDSVRDRVAALAMGLVHPGLRRCRDPRRGHHRHRVRAGRSQAFRRRRLTSAV